LPELLFDIKKLKRYHLH